jgi:hypothetical protein
VLVLVRNRLQLLGRRLSGARPAFNPPAATRRDVSKDPDGFLSLVRYETSSRMRLDKTLTLCSSWCQADARRTAGVDQRDDERSRPGHVQAVNVKSRRRHNRARREQTCMSRPVNRPAIAELLARSSESGMS